MDKEKSENKQTNKQKQQNKIKKNPRFLSLSTSSEHQDEGCCFTSEAVIYYTILATTT